MEAANLTISVPNRGCDKKCPYCISRITPRVYASPHLMNRNIEKVKTVARAANVTTVLMTGKGEPCLNATGLIDLCEEFKEWPLELQTNGIYLNENPSLIRVLKLAGLDTIAVSLDILCELEQYKPLWDEAYLLGMTTRLCLNITNKTWYPTPYPYKLENIVGMCKRNHINQLLFRNIVAPRGTAGPEVDWIAEHTDPEFWDSWTTRIRGEIKDKGRFLYDTPFGMSVWDYDGVAVTDSDYCIQEYHHTKDIRSLIFQEDGHLYTNWNSLASRLF